MDRKTLPTQVTYTADRLGSLLVLQATCQAPIFSKLDFEPVAGTLPPIFRLYEIHQSIPLFPESRIVIHKELLVYPEWSKYVHVEDGDGFHRLEISGIDVPDFNISGAGSSSRFCVFLHDDGEKLVAPCDARVPPDYERVFGPATYEECARHQ